MKRIVTALVVAGIAVAGAGVAWAQTSGDGDGAARRGALRECVRQARQDHPDATRAELKPFVKSCLEEHGIAPRFTPEQKEQAKACLEQAKGANPGADRATIRQAARQCLEQAGLVPPLTPEQQARRAKFRECLAQARADHPGDPAAIRDAVKECMGG